MDWQRFSQIEEEELNEGEYGHEYLEFVREDEARSLHWKPSVHPVWTEGILEEESFGRLSSEVVATGLQARTRAQLWHGEGRRRCPGRLPVHSVGQSASGRHRSDDAHEGVGRFSGGHGRPQNGN